jgi:dTDP-4-dehydrorhamnose reductase
MRVLLTGSHGLLGAAIQREFNGHEVIPLDRAELDITDPGAVGKTVTEARPDLIVNCAAYNDVDRAEDEPAAALDANAFGVQSVARAAAAAGAVLVHYSSDFVFDGETDRPYTEDDPPNPRSVYAASKLLGDWFALASARAYVLRVASLFGRPGVDGTRRGSLGSLVDRIRRGDEVAVFTDRTVSPTCTDDIARATRRLLETTAPHGLYHCVNTGPTSWDRVAQHIADLLGKPLRARPVTLATVNLRARRPRYSALDNGKLAAAACEMPRWEDAVENFLRS